MSWVTVIWSMVAAACMTLAAVHVLIWCARRTAWVNLLFALTAIATAGMAGSEMGMMRALTPAQYAGALRWLHLAAWIAILGLVGFVRVYFRAGRAWLAWTVVALRTLSLLLNFTVGQNLNFLETTRLRQVPVLGEPVSIAEGVPNPLMLVGQLSLLLLILFVADAAAAVWRRGGRRQALAVGGSILFFLLAGAVMAVLVTWQLAPVPFTASLAFTGVVGAMAWEMSREALAAARMGDDLRESEARYRSIFDGAVEGMFRTSVQGECLVANTALARMLGYSSADEAVRVVGNTAHQVWAEPDERGRYLRLLEERGTVRGYECQFKRKDGTGIWVSLSTQAVRGPDGRVAYFDGFVEEITERRQREDALRLSEARVVAAIQAAGLGFYEMAEDGRVTFLDDRFKALFGMSPEDGPRGREFWLAHVHPEDLPGVLQMSRQVLEGKVDHIAGEYRYMHPSQGLIWVHHLSRVLDRDAAGRPVRLMGVVSDISERKLARKALEDSERRYRTLFEAAPEGILVIGTDGRVRAANSAQARLYGYDSPQQLEGMHAPLFVAERDRARAAATMRDLLKGEDRPVRRYSAVRRDGSEFVAEVTSGALRGPQEEVQGYLCLTRDVTEHVETDAALRASEERLREAAEAAEFGVYEYDFVNGQSFYSPEFLALYGLPAGAALELDADGAPKRLHPEDRARFLDAMQRANAPRGSGIFEAEYRIFLPDGRVRWLRARGRNVFAGQEADRRPLRANGIIHDITARKQAAEALRETKERYQTLFASMAEGVLELDAAGVIVTCNARAEQAMGLPADQLVGMTLFDPCWRITHEDGSPFRSALHPVTVTLQTGQACADTVMGIHRPDGALVWLEVNSQPLFRAGADQPCAVVLTFADISKRRQMELDTQMLRLELAHVSRVAGMGELVASLAHELNQPLTAIQSNAQAAQRMVASGQPDWAEIREILADIVADDLRAAEVIRRVRSLLKKDGVARKALDLNSVVREVLGFLRTDAIIKGIGVTTDLSSGRLLVVGDRIQLQQVVLNLVVNAFDAMRTSPAGARKLTIRSARSEPHGALVTVEDSGSGIPPAKMSHLFEPFFTSKPEGLGMGLAICRSIMESHGGRIWAEQAPAGAVFKFALPISQEAQS